MAKQPGRLVRVSDSSPGISRSRRGSGFIYRDARGRHLTSTAELGRIRALAIPPAYTDVWICARANGHLQATGLDARGRKQYRYHPRWREQRDARKFDRMRLSRVSRELGRFGRLKRSRPHALLRDGAFRPAFAGAAFAAGLRWCRLFASSSLRSTTLLCEPAASSIGSTSSVCPAATRLATSACTACVNLSS
jgi:hypothetical protein